MTDKLKELLILCEGYPTPPLQQLKRSVLLLVAAVIDYNSNTEVGYPRLLAPNISAYSPSYNFKVSSSMLEEHRSSQDRPG
jgi:hypothetical protein